MDLLVAAAFALLFLVALAQWAADRSGPGSRLARLIGASGIRPAVRRSLIVLALVPSLGLVVILTMHDVEREQDDLLSSTVAASRSASFLIDSFLTRYTHSITATAEAIAIDGELQPDHLARHLSGFHSVNPDFLTMLVADVSGRILVATGRGDADHVRRLDPGRESVADRPYFLRTIRSRRREVSDAFVGRGFGTDHIVAITAPVEIRGQLAGIVEGSLDLDAFERLDRQFASIFGGQLILLDTHGRVVYAPSTSGLAFLQTWSPPVDDAGPATVGPIGSRDYFIASSGTRYGWRAIVLRPKLSLLSRLWSAYRAAAGWLIASLAGAIMLSWALAQRVAAPLSALLRTLAQYDDGTAPGVTAASRMPSEYLTVFRHLHRVQRRQQQAKRDLQDSLDAERRLAGQLESAVARLESADRAKNAFLATASHELRTPLNAIVGFSHLLEMEAAGPMNEEQLRQIGIVRRSGESLRGLVADILDVTTIEGGHFSISPECFDLVELLRDTLPPFVAEAAGRGFDFRFTPAPRAVEVTADPRRLDQILRNLLSNAIKFTDAGSIEVGVETPAEGASHVRLFVRDTGIGIAPEHHPRLFKPFNRVETVGDSRPGTGLGLAICRQLAEAMGCRIGLVSDAGKGSTFWLEIPLSARGAGAARGSGVAPGAEGSHDAPVRVVQDHGARDEPREVGRALRA